MNNHGKSNVAFIIGVLLLAGLVIGILDLNGVINVRALLGGEGHFVPIDYEKEVKKMCDLVDEEGSYNHEELEKMTESIEEFSKNEDNQELSYNDMWKKVWKSLKGKKACNNHRCLYFEDSDEYNIYSYDCKENKSRKQNFKEYYEDSYADFMLDNVCTIIDDKGEFKSETITCKKFFCTITLFDKPYTRNCMKNR